MKQTFLLILALAACACSPASTALSAAQALVGKYVVSAAPGCEASVHASLHGAGIEPNAKVTIYVRHRNAAGEWVEDFKIDEAALLQPHGVELRIGDDGVARLERIGTCRTVALFPVSGQCNPAAMEAPPAVLWRSDGKF